MWVTGALYGTKAFFREAMTWKSLDHKFILGFLGVWRDERDGTWCAVIPWMANGTIRQHMVKNEGTYGLDTIHRWVCLLKQVRGRL